MVNWTLRGGICVVLLSSDMGRMTRKCFQREDVQAGDDNTVFTR